MFVVVAIVIFGIFVGLSYTLFGDTLKPAIVNLFTDAIEKTDGDIDGLITKEHVGDKDFYWNTEENKGVTAYTFDSKRFKPNGSYKITFDITLVSGNLKTIGGHSHLSSNEIVKIDGVKVESPYAEAVNAPSYDWRFGVPIDIDIGETKHVEFTFVADRYNNPIEHPLKTINVDFGRNMINKDSVWTQVPLEDFEATATNFSLVEVLN